MVFISCLILVFHLQTLVVLSQNIVNGNVTIGESLNALESQQFSSSWRSPNGDFAFGFRKIQPNGFTLSIWFDKIPDKTTVWHAQIVNTTTGLVPDGSKVTLTADRGLVLTDPRGQQLWRSLFSSGSVSRGRMTDDGNFRLFSVGTEDLWSSFANPTDTLLPNQSIELGGNLSSRMTETSFKKGRFRLSLRPKGDFTEGDLQLVSLNSETLKESDIDYYYYASHTNDPNSTNYLNRGIRLVFNQSGDLYVLQRNYLTFIINDKKEVLEPSTNFYHHAVLHFDGVFAQYYRSKGEVNDRCDKV